MYPLTSSVLKSGGYDPPPQLLWVRRPCELYMFYAGQGELAEKMLKPMGGGRPNRFLFLNPPLLLTVFRYAVI